MEIVVDVDGIDFGNDELNQHARKADMFDTARFPAATYKGRLDRFKNGVPTQVIGNLTLHGVIQPVPLTINQFKCMPHPILKREVCVADAMATIQRDKFGIDSGKDYGFNMDVNLRIQVEAVQEE